MSSFIKFTLDPNKDLTQQISNKYLTSHPNMLRYRSEYIREYDVEFQDGYGYYMPVRREETIITATPRHFSKPTDLHFADLLSFLRFWEIIK